MTSVEDAVREITHYYANYHSARWVGDLLVLRLARLPDPEALEKLSKAIDMAKLDGALKASEIDRIIKDNYALADSLEITGTPAFIVGDTMVPGVADIATLRKLVAEARTGG